MTETLVVLLYLSESFLMNTNMTGFRWLSKIAFFSFSGEYSLSIVKVNLYAAAG